MRRGARAAAAGLALVLSAGACSGGGDEAGPISGVHRENAPSPDGAPGDDAERLPVLPERFTSQSVDWGPCGAPTAAQGGGEAPAPLPDGTPWECGTLTVPLDYGDPDGETLSIALIRARAASGGNRLGSLVFNFGGPGGSGVATLPRLSDAYAALHDGYDLVSFDPRGVGESAGVVCLSDAEIDALGQHDAGPPRTPAEERAVLDRARAYAAACQRNAGDLLPHLTTENTARDLDLLRAALGERQLNYAGTSYGTKLGAVYAHLFPERVGRTVLDAVVDPTSDVIERGLRQAEGFQLALDSFLDDCARFASCPVPGDGAGPEANRWLEELFGELARSPLPTADGRSLTGGLAVTGVLSLLYSEGSWDYLRRALAQAAEEGAGDLLLAAADSYNGRDDQGRYSTLHAANTAINCADFASRPTLETVRAREDDFAAASPVFGPTLAWSLLSCAGWPVTGTSDQPEVSAEGAGEGEILLLGTTGDPATPFAGAERMQRALGGDVGVLLTYEGEGHGAYTSGDPCVTRAVDAHLLAGTTPEDGTVCR